MDGDFYLDIIGALNNALYIGKYITNHDEKYKKDKKRIKKMLEDTENGLIGKYLTEPLDEDSYD